MPTLIAKSTRSHAASTARLEARIPRELKRTLEKAAAATGHPTLTSFVIDSLRASAHKAIEERQQARLSADASKRFVEAHLAPEAPNAALRSAFRRYRKARSAV